MCAAYFNDQVKKKTWQSNDTPIGLSAGSNPSTTLNPQVVQALLEIGIDIRNKAFPKPWTQEVINSSRVIITMGCGDSCPIPPEGKGKLT